MKLQLLTLILLALFSLTAAASRNILVCAIALGAASVMLTLALFRMAAPWAAIFELSVCAGLITVLFISAITLIRKHEAFLKENRLRFMLMPLAAVIFGTGLLFLGPKLTGALNAPGLHPESMGFGMTLWGVRSMDIVGQLCIFIAGVLAITVFFRKKGGGNA